MNILSYLYLDIRYYHRTNLLLARNRHAKLARDALVYILGFTVISQENNYLLYSAVGFTYFKFV
jgi:hypothetical protein